MKKVQNELVELSNANLRMGQENNQELVQVRDNMDSMLKRINSILKGTQWVSDKVNSESETMSNRQIELANQNRAEFNALMELTNVLQLGMEEGFQNVIDQYKSMNLLGELSDKVTDMVEMNNALIQICDE
jgi:phosphate-selective porin